MKRREIIIHINKKEVSLREIIEDMHNIHKIVFDMCPYCERNNITTDKEKLKIIASITKKYFGDNNE